VREVCRTSIEKDREALTGILVHIVIKEVFVDLNWYPIADVVSLGSSLSRASVSWCVQKTNFHKESLISVPRTSFIPAQAPAIPQMSLANLSNMTLILFNHVFGSPHLLLKKDSRSIVK